MNEGAAPPFFNLAVHGDYGVQIREEKVCLSTEKMMGGQCLRHKELLSAYIEGNNDLLSSVQYFICHEGAIERCPFQISTRTPTLLTEVVRGVPQSVPAKVSQIGPRPSTSTSFPIYFPFNLRYSTPRSPSVRHWACRQIIRKKFETAENVFRTNLFRMSRDYSLLTSQARQVYIRVKCLSLCNTDVLWHFLARHFLHIHYFENIPNKNI